MKSTLEHWNDWLEGPVKRLAPNTQDQYRRIGGTIPAVCPSVDDLTPRTLRRNFKEMKETPIKANRWKAIASSFCAYLVEEEIIDINPAAGIRRFDEQHRERFLKENELAAVADYMHAGAINLATQTAIRLMLSTGVRVSEAVGIGWDEVHLQPDGSMEWHLDAIRTKASRPLITRIPPALVVDFTELAGLSGKQGRILRTTPTDVLGADTTRKALTRLCKKMSMSHFSPHDLRRTVGTLMAKHGVNIEVRKAVLNHASSGVTNIHYNQYDYWPEKVEALKLMEKILTDCGIYRSAV